MRPIFRAVSMSVRFPSIPRDLPSNNSRPCGKNRFGPGTGIPSASFTSGLVYHRHHHLPVVIRGKQNPLLIHQWDLGTSMPRLHPKRQVFGDQAGHAVLGHDG